jgi:hypothetical protein
LKRRGLRWWPLGLLLMGGAAGLLVWQARQPGQSAVAAPELPSSAAVAHVAALPALARQPEAASAGLTTHAASSPLQSKVAKEFVDVCGVGRIRRSELEPGEGQSEPVWSHELNRLNEQGLSDMLKRLDAGSLRQRVAAAALRGDAQTAAQLAAGSDDVNAYRIALQACRKDQGYRSAYLLTKQQAQLAASAASGLEMPEFKPPGPLPSACAGINLERLESFDPGDAWPWLLRLSDAITRNDQTGVSQALYQVAQRSRLSANARILSATMAEVVGPEPTPGESWALASALGTDMMSLGDVSPINVARPCSVDALKDANRRQLCEQVVRRMPGMVKEGIDARALHVLEERLGIAHSPEALSREDLDRRLKGIGEESMQWMAEPTCANFSKMGQLVVHLTRNGELAMMRAQLKAVPASGPR